MLIKSSDSLDAVFQTLKHELHRGALDSKHPFRFMTLATGAGQNLSARYVVLRKVDEDLNFYFFSDLRTDKIKALRSNPGTALVFYHPNKRVQIRVKGEAVLHHGNDVAKGFWTRIQGDAQNAYQPIYAPGAIISHPEAAYHWEGKFQDHYFAVIQIIPKHMDLLQLNGQTHIRVGFEKTGKDWQINWLAP
ncbi:pyridoxamine 5'-phosphate oxidase family protein [Pararhodonellum marinum]|uniref:pyridoxamine 5'-phosphate oxidase family protein n=1 Tax=Pararhodonellum marinum TaxID=2755358 RepID=UPI00188E9083|nr:pyridoxamine 5'-phosphate oxidase family protein [Pararhodonellum marinum]